MLLACRWIIVISIRGLLYCILKNLLKQNRSYMPQLNALLERFRGVLHRFSYDGCFDFIRILLGQNAKLVPHWSALSEGHDFLRQLAHHGVKIKLLWPELIGNSFKGFKSCQKFAAKVTWWAHSWAFWGENEDRAGFSSWASPQQFDHTISARLTVTFEVNPSQFLRKIIQISTVPPSKHICSPINLILTVRPIGHMGTRFSLCQRSQAVRCPKLSSNGLAVFATIWWIFRTKMSGKGGVFVYLSYFGSSSPSPLVRRLPIPA